MRVRGAVVDDVSDLALHAQTPKIMEVLCIGGDASATKGCLGNYLIHGTGPG